MKLRKIIYNPYLPEGVYMPDGEPHVFNDRIYCFSSHDKEGGNSYCLLPYEFYSAPVDDLSDWTSKGVSYNVEQDPLSSEKRHEMYAPDVVRGNDGRYYLYYGLAGFRGNGGYFGPISVAVADEPDGPYSYLGIVRNKDGSPHNEMVTFDPAVINDDGIIRLYYGTLYPYDEWRESFLNDPLSLASCGDKSETIKAENFKIEETDKILMDMFGRSKEELEAARKNYGSVMGPVTVRLSDDMLTVESDICRITPYKVKGTEWEEHPFYEGSSIRKIGDTYYFIYSSLLNHELCYATSKYPDRDFHFRGTIISTGDIGLNGRQAADRLNMTGTTHGSIEFINGKWYVFYHRLTHGTDYSRQALAEEIKINPDGSIDQVEVTSQGLYGRPLPAEGSYPAYICCNLTNGHMPHGSNSKINEVIPMITNEGEERFVTNLSDSCWMGFKYFEFKDNKKLGLKLRVDDNVNVVNETDENKHANVNKSYENKHANVENEAYENEYANVIDASNGHEQAKQTWLCVYSSMDGECLARKEISHEIKNEWLDIVLDVDFPLGKAGLFVKIEGAGNISIKEIEFPL